MAQWKIKQMSHLTGVSVRTLHHYDKIGLLSPSMRTSNGYRIYSKENLAKLQQIIALKFFGFSLSQIKTMLQQKLSIREHLLIQQKILVQQADNIRRAQDALDVVLERFTESKSLDWKSLVILIERYNTMKPTIKTIEPIKVLSVSRTGKYTKAGEEAWCILTKFLKKHNISTDKARALGICPDNPATTPEDQQRYSACITFEGDVQPEGDVSIQTIEGGTYVVFTYKGSYEDLHKACYNIFHNWLPESGKTLRKIPMFEDYVVCQLTEKDASKFVTDIYVPIEK